MGIISNMIIDEIIERFKITDEMVDKIKSVIDNVDIQTEDGTTVIEINVKKIKIVIEKPAA
jgi:hypothetical protein